jgi:hypothetical protein
VVDTGVSPRATLCRATAAFAGSESDKSLFDSYGGFKHLQVLPYRVGSSWGGWRTAVSVSRHIYERAELGCALDGVLLWTHAISQISYLRFGGGQLRQRSVLLRDSLLHCTERRHSLLAHASAGRRLRAVDVVHGNAGQARSQAGRARGNRGRCASTAQHTAPNLFT